MEPVKSLGKVGYGDSETQVRLREGDPLERESQTCHKRAFNSQIQFGVQFIIDS